MMNRTREMVQYVCIYCIFFSTLEGFLYVLIYIRFISFACSVSELKCVEIRGNGMAISCRTNMVPNL